MAIPFLNNINLDNNEIQNVRLQNAGSPPASSGAGQIYFDTSADINFGKTARYYSNVTDTWLSLKEYTFPAGGFITGTVTGTTPKPIITFDLSATGTPSASVYLRGDNAWEPISTIPGTYTWTISSDAGSSAVASGSTVSFVGAGTTSTALVGTILTITSNDQFVGTVTSLGTATPTTITIAGTSAIPTVSTITAAIVNAGTALATGDQIYDFVTTQIGNIPSGLSFEGNWNANTDTPTLSGTTPASGVFYIVSVAGSTSLSGITDWEVGDWAVYVSNGAGVDAWQKIDNSSTLSGSGVANQVTYWTGTANVAGDTGFTYDATGNNLSVDNNITAGNKVYATGGNSLEWNTAYENSITALAVSGTATKTLTATQQDGGTLTASWTDTDSGGTVTSIATTAPITGGTITATGTIGITTASTGVIGAGAVAAGTGISVAYASGIATVTNTQTNSANTFTNTGPFPAAGTSYTISSATHGLGTNSAIIMVQLVEVSTGETIYTDVVRGASGLITITFAVSQAINTFRALLQKIG